MSLLLALGFLLLISSSQGQLGGGGNNQPGGDILSDQTAPAQLPSIRSQQQTQGFPQNFAGFPQQNNLGTQGLGGGVNPFQRQPFLRPPPFLPRFGRPGQPPFFPSRGSFLPFPLFRGRPGFPPIGGRPGFLGFPGAPLGQQIPFQQQPPFLGGAGGQGQGLLGQGGNGAVGNQGNNGQRGQQAFGTIPPFSLPTGTGGAGFQLPTNGQQPWNIPNFNQGQSGQGGGLQLPTNGQGGQGGTPGGLNLPNVPGGLNFLNGGAPGGLNPQTGGTPGGLNLPNVPGGLNFLNGGAPGGLNPQAGGTPGGLNLPNVPGGLNFLNGGAPGGLNPQTGPGSTGGLNFLNGQNGQGIASLPPFSFSFPTGTTGGLQLPTNGQGGQGLGGAGGLQLPNNVLPQQMQQRSFPRVNSGQGLQQGNLADSPFTDVVGGSTNWDSLGQTQIPAAGGLPAWMQGGQTQIPAAGGPPAWMQGGIQNPAGNAQGAQNNALQENGQNGGLQFNPFGLNQRGQGQLPLQLPNGNPFGGNNGAQGANNQNPWTPSTPSQQQNTGVSDLLPGFTFPDNSGLTSTPGNGGRTTQAGNIDLSSLFSQGSGTETPSIDFSSLFGNNGGGLDTTQTSQDANIQNMFQAMQSAVPPLGTNANNGNQGTNPFAGLTAGNQPTQGSQSTIPFGNNPLGGNQGSPFSGAPGTNPFQAFQGNPGAPTGGIHGLNAANPFGNQENSQSNGAQGSNPFGNLPRNNPFGGMPGFPAPGGQGNNPFGGQPGSNPFAGMQGLGGLPGANMTGLPNPFESAGGLPPFMSGIPGFPQFPSSGGVSQTGQSTTSTGTGNNQGTPDVFNPPASQLDFLQGLGTANNPFPGSSSGGQESGNSPFSSQSNPSNGPFSGSASGTDPFSSFRGFDPSNVAIPGTSPFSR